MKMKIALAALALPVAFAGVVAFHPGVAYAGSPLAKLQATLFPQTGTYTVDPAHTSVGFEIDHLGVSRVQGRFGKAEGKLNVDLKNPSASSVGFTIATDSIDTAVAPRDAHLRTADFFDTAKYPEIRFQSTKIRRAGKGYVAEGNLTMKATTKKIAIPFRVHGPITDPWGATRLGIVAVPIKLNRQEYGIAYNDKLPSGVPAVGNEVVVRLSLEATLDKAASAK